MNQTNLTELYRQQMAELLKLCGESGFENEIQSAQSKLRITHTIMKDREPTDKHSIARRRMIKALPFLAVGGVMTLLSSCSPVHNTARRTSRRTSRRVSRRY